VLFLVFGSSAAGKTYTLRHLRDRAPGNLEIHDFDEVGAPKHPTLAWRYEANEQWIRRTIGAERLGLDLLVAGQTPLGEMLAAPSAPQIRIRACLLDCDDQTRIARIEGRGDGWLESAGGRLDDYIAWGQWMRGHAADPSYRIEAIRRDDTLGWDRFDCGEFADAWPVPVIDTTQPIEAVVGELESWVKRERRVRDEARDEVWRAPG
jgi:hypothetical protein